MQINPREVACDTILEILNNGAYNNLQLKKALKQNGAMSQVDKAFVTDIVNGTLRNIQYIDFFINKLSSVKTNKIKPLILAIIRISMYQIFFLDKVPHSAVCNEAVKLAKKRGFKNLSGFVNGVLRSATRIEKAEIKNMLPSKKKNPVDYLCVTYSYPKWMISSWLKSFEFDFVEELCVFNNKPPVVTVNCNTLKISVDDLKKNLEKENVVVTKGNLNDNALHLKKINDMTKLKAYKEGLFNVQDESSMLVAEILNPKPNDKILDVCAAPGGKSIFMSQLMKNEGEIIACDIYEHKLDIINENAKRLGIDIIKPTLLDATVSNDAFVEKFSKVLIDAPCSGFGIIRKKPDIKLKKDSEDITSLISIQRKILENASKYVAKDGVLVYSTCTINDAENLENIKWFTDKFNFKLIPIDKDLSETAKDGHITLFPNVHKCDGFFIAHMQRKE